MNRVGYSPQPLVEKFLRPLDSVLNLIKSTNSLKPSGMDITTILMISISGLGGLLLIVFLIFLVIRSRNENKEENFDKEDKISQGNYNINEKGYPETPNPYQDVRIIDETNRSSNMMIGRGKASNNASNLNNTNDYLQENRSRIIPEVDNTDLTKRIEENFSVMQEMMSKKIVEIDSLAKERENKSSTDEENRVVFKQTDYSQDKEIENENRKKIVEDFKENESLEEVSFREKTENPSVKSEKQNNPRNRQNHYPDDDSAAGQAAQKPNKIGERKTKYNYDNIEEEDNHKENRMGGQNILYQDGVDYRKPSQINNIHTSQQGQPWEKPIVDGGPGQQASKMSQSVIIKDQNGRKQQQHRDEPVSYINHWYSKDE